MSKIKAEHQISPVFVFFLIHGAQFGAGVLGFARIIAKAAGYDGWIGVFITGIIIHILLWMMYFLLKETNGNLIDLQRQTFGKWLGNGINLIFMAYFLTVSISVIRTYVEIIQVWMFPSASIWMLTTFLCLVGYYIISSGFRVITGICVISIGGTLGYLFISLFILKYTHWSNLLPVFSHSLSDILKAAQLSIYTMSGFEIFLMIYPFVKESKKSHKFAQYGVLFSNLLYLFSTLLAFTFFSEKQLSKTIWAQLSMTQVIQLPFIERLEYIAISAYALVIVTSFILPLWAATRGTHEIFRVKQRGVLITFLLITLIVSQLLTNRHDINDFISNASRVSFWLIYIYIPILFIIVWVKRKWKKSKEN
ncbi:MULTISPECIES: spore germination protein [Bacillus]|uniref:Spore germination protein n=3 Tax=Bacillus cereus group TaxID=86661 RepID=A9VL96_BACMK|nr:MULTISPECIES: spore germination protein [Bacillus cereus group]EJQ65834.1 spore germination protein (amino acid permease) [Bacillus cereus HuA2-4]ABY45720.1 spore germination protein [Bacillus mycoides KBAB4]EOO69558.1 spore germination protein (amino acid permease) [Bacillus cereus VD021]QWH08592.1 spore gernimation protein GerH [Bacillus mycoides]VXB55444.1 Spore germination protein (Amino acid permease) [Bacillus mycoides]